MAKVKALGRYGEKDRRFAAVIEGYVKLSHKRPKDIAARADTCLSTYYERLKEPEKMTVRELRAYISAIQIPEEEILDFLYERK